MDKERPRWALCLCIDLYNYVSLSNDAMLENCCFEQEVVGRILEVILNIMPRISGSICTFDWSRRAELCNINLLHYPSPGDDIISFVMSEAVVITACNSKMLFHVSYSTAFWRANLREINSYSARSYLQCALHLTVRSELRWKKIQLYLPCPGSPAGQFHCCFEERETTTQASISEQTQRNYWEQSSRTGRCHY